MMLLLAMAPLAAGAGPLRDPFARAERAAASAAAPAAQAAADSVPVADPAPPQPRLHAIVFARGQALADIDGLVLREGDRAGDWRVVGIEERCVRLKRGEASLVLQFDRETKR